MDLEAPLENLSGHQDLKHLVQALINLQVILDTLQLHQEMKLDQ